MKQWRSTILITILAVAVSFANIGGLDVYALDEAKNAEAAREMYESGNLVVPYFNYELRTDKPPLHYYFMIAGFELFGPNAYGARFFSSLFGVLTILITFLFVKRHVSERAGIFSALVLISSIHFALQFHMSVPDPYLVFFLTWAFYSFYNAYVSQDRWALFAFYFAIGCGLLTKGPIALGLPGLTVVAFLLLKRDFKLSTIWRLQPFGGLIISLAVALPWYYAVHLQTNGLWTEGFFLKHNFDRFSDAMEGHNGIFLLTFGYVFMLGMLGVLPFVFQAVKSAAVQWKQNDVLLYLLTGTGVIVIFFAISSTKLPNYTVPAYPLLAALTGIYLSTMRVSWLRNRANKIGLIAYAVFMIVFPAGLYFGIDADPSLTHLSYLALYFLPLTIMGFWLLYLVVKSNKGSDDEAFEPRFFLATSAGWTVTVILFFYMAFPQVDAENPVRKTLPQMNTEAKIISYKRLNAAYVFALQKQINRIDSLPVLQEAMQGFEEGYVISRTEYREELEAIPGLVYHTEAKDTFENPTTLIMKWGKP